MINCVHQAPFSRWRNRRQDKRKRQLQKLSNMRAAKARKRIERGRAGLLEREPKFIPWHPLEFGVRDKVSGETVWIDLKSLRDAQRRLAVVLKYYVPNHPRHDTLTPFRPRHAIP